MRGLRSTFAVAVATVLTAPTWVAGPPAQGRSQPAPVAGPVVTLAHHGYEPSVAVDRRGDTTVVWSGSASWSSRNRIFAARRPAGRSWRRPVVIARGFSPVLAVSPAGDVTVVFNTQRRGWTTGIAAVRKPVGRGWQKPHTLSRDRTAAGYPSSDEGTYGAHQGAVAVNERGDVVVAWQWGSYDRNAPFRIQVARRPARGAWSRPTRVSGRGWAEGPSVALDGRGNATVVYDPDDAGLVARRLVVGAGWRSPRELPGSSGANGASVLVDRRGNATVLYHRWARDHDTLVAVRRPVRGSWGRSQRISTRGAYVWDSSAAVDGAGTVWVSWSRRLGRVNLVHRPAAGPWTRSTLVATRPSGAEGAWLRSNDAGDLVVSWNRGGDYRDKRLVARVRHHVRGWTPVFAVSPGRAAFSELDAAVYANSDVAATWQSRGGAVKFRRFGTP